MIEPSDLRNRFHTRGTKAQLFLQRLALQDQGQATFAFAAALATTCTATFTTTFAAALPAALVTALAPAELAALTSAAAGAQQEATQSFETTQSFEDAVEEVLPGRAQRAAQGVLHTMASFDILLLKNWY